MHPCSLSIWSLPRELRDIIYELALEPRINVYHDLYTVEQDPSKINKRFKFCLTAGGSRPYYADALHPGPYILSTFSLLLTTRAINCEIKNLLSRQLLYFGNSDEACTQESVIAPQSSLLARIFERSRFVIRIDLEDRIYDIFRNIHLQLFEHLTSVALTGGPSATRGTDTKEFHPESPEWWSSLVFRERGIANTFQESSKWWSSLVHRYRGIDMGDESPIEAYAGPIRTILRLPNLKEVSVWVAPTDEPEHAAFSFPATLQFGHAFYWGRLQKLRLLYATHDFEAPSYTPLSLLMNSYEPDWIWGAATPQRAEWFCWSGRIPPLLAARREVPGEDVWKAWPNAEAAWVVERASEPRGHNPPPRWSASEDVWDEYIGALDDSD